MRPRCACSTASYDRCVARNDAVKPVVKKAAGSRSDVAGPRLAGSVAKLDSQKELAMIRRSALGLMITLSLGGCFGQADPADMDEAESDVGQRSDALSNDYQLGVVQGVVLDKSSYTYGENIVVTLQGLGSCYDVEELLSLGLGKLGWATLPSLTTENVLPMKLVLSPRHPLYPPHAGNFTLKAHCRYTDQERAAQIIFK
jgi:hypothetical protein